MVHIIAHANTHIKRRTGRTMNPLQLAVFDGLLSTARGRDMVRTLFLSPMMFSNFAFRYAICLFDWC